MYFRKGVENIEGRNKIIYEMEGSRKKYIKFQKQYIDIRTYKKTLKKRGQRGGESYTFVCETKDNGESSSGD